MSWESGNFCPRSSNWCGGVGTTRAAKDRAFGNWVLNAWTPSPDCLVARVILSSSGRRSSSVPTICGVLLASSSSCVNAYECCSNVEWSHSGGRNRCDCRSVICFCNAIICARWSHTLCIMAAGSVYYTTLLSTSSAHSSNVCLSPKSISSRFLLTIPSMMAWSSADTRATRSCCSDHDIATIQTHLPVAIVCVNVRGGWGKTFNNNQLHRRRFCCGCCRWCVSFHWMRA